MKSSGLIRTILLVGTKLQEKEQALMTYAFHYFLLQCYPTFISAFQETDSFPLFSIPIGTY